MKEEVSQAMFIPKKGFGALIESIIAQFLMKIHVVAHQEELKNVQLSKDKVDDFTSLFTSAVEHPIIEKIQGMIGASLKKSVDDKLNFPEASSALTAQLGELDAKEIQGYFKCKTYGGKRYSEQLIRDLFPKATIVAKAFENLADKSDPDHPDNVRALEVQDSIEKANEKEAIKQFTTQFSTWIMDQKSALNAKSDPKYRAFHLQVVDKNLLKANLSKMKSPSYATDYWDEVAKTILEKVAKTPTISLGEIKDFAERVFNDKSNDIVIKKLAEKAIDTNQVTSFPNGLVDWLESSVKNSSSD